MKFGQLIKHNTRNISLPKIMQKWRRKTSFRLLFGFKKASFKLKGTSQHLSFNISWKISTCSYIKTNLKTFQTVDPETYSILIFYRRIRDLLFHYILRMISQEKYFSFYILLTDQISLSGCLCFLRYWTICVL